MVNRAHPSCAGLSPRVRGNRCSGSRAGAVRRSIPACAGEPGTETGEVATWRVYPRVCGGTAVVERGGLSGRGLSPRVRGNRFRKWSATDRDRSIPACAGEPLAEAAMKHGSLVYPRVCGGTSSTAPIDSTKPGLSPRVRGNPVARVTPKAFPRSIPACAGEPSTRRATGGMRRGLSPRVRGNHAALRDGPPRERSIPACAGEPRRSRRPRARRRVYPRVCGGTGSSR